MYKSFTVKVLYLSCSLADLKFHLSAHRYQFSFIKLCSRYNKNKVFRNNKTTTANVLICV